MAGNRLRKLEASETVDILHYLFEDDFSPRWEQDAAVKSNFREVIYEKMYKSKYKYIVESEEKKRTAKFGTFDVDEDFALNPPSSTETKPYIAPTDEADLHRILGGPAGG